MIPFCFHDANVQTRTASFSLEPKVLIIGGGIANFTDVAATFTGIITALKQFAEELRDGKISIWVRRAGPNYQEVRTEIFHRAV